MIATVHKLVPIGIKSNKMKQSFTENISRNLY